MLFAQKGLGHGDDLCSSQNRKISGRYIFSFSERMRLKIFIDDVPFQNRLNYSYYRSDRIDMIGDLIRLSG